MSPELNWQSGTDAPVSELLLSVRAERVLKNDQIETIAQLKALSDAEILRMPDVGKVTLRELREEVARWEREDKQAWLDAHPAWVPPVLPPPQNSEQTELLKSINMHLEAIAWMIRSSKSDQLLLQISVMMQYAFQEHFGVNPNMYFQKMIVPPPSSPFTVPVKNP